MSGKVLIIDDEKLIRWSLEKNLKNLDYQVESAASGEEGLNRFDIFCPEAVILDNKLPGMQGLDVLTELRTRDPRLVVLFMTAFGTIETAVEAMKRGAYDYVNKPFVFDEVRQLLEKGLYVQRLDSEVSRLRAVERRQFDTANVIINSLRMREIISLVDKVARSEAHTVLLTGESGTGKDLFARVIHQRSFRSALPFITINCASVPETLLESELFGHEKGAFTDAKSAKRGQFELASGGVVYLDEIGEIPLGLQVKLLQVIENRVFRRVGGVKDIRIDVLIIAATNIDLAAAVERGSFRRDLYYRLELIPIHIPPLRERRADIVPIAEYFIQRFNQEFHKKFVGLSGEVKDVLADYDWPGNIRELRNVIERIIILENDDSIRLEHLPFDLRRLFETVKMSSGILPVQDLGLVIPDGGLSLEAVEHELVVKALAKCAYNQTRAARLLDITRDSLRYKMKKFNLLSKLQK
ncbi:MAG: sigma-54-dependent Fis family transcriptional regulator [Calditrichaeota bacterium]|nr:sigma-54-dependent Fis family transcriptional regulator [Calditrichota bacterium]